MGLYSHRNFGFKKKRDCTICVAKTKTLNSCALLHSGSASLFLPMQIVGFLMWRFISFFGNQTDSVMKYTSPPMDNFRIGHGQNCPLIFIMAFHFEIMGQFYNVRRQGLMILAEYFLQNGPLHFQANNIPIPVLYIAILSSLNRSKFSAKFNLAPWNHSGMSAIPLLLSITCKINCFINKILQKTFSSTFMQRSTTSLSSKCLHVITKRENLTLNRRIILTFN